MRVIAALSGGVDSAVAAALAKEAGHEVTAVHMALTTSQASTRCSSRGCCTVEDATDARQAAALIDIPFYVWDLADIFHQTVITDFISEYKQGRTPNPCVRCNEFVKFRELLERGIALGFDAVCTGHYANLAVDPQGEVSLSRAACQEKDQSYVVAVMGEDALRHVIFPLGHYTSKAEVRAEAANRGFPMSNKPDSYDICFIPDGNTSGFLKQHLGSQTGQFIDSSGNVLGTHDGAFQFTVGQRKGLNLRNLAPNEPAKYVLRTDVNTNQVFVGTSEILHVNTIMANQLVPLAPLTHPAFNGELEVGIQYRAHGAEIPAKVYIEGDSLMAKLLTPTRAVAAGQSLVVYYQNRALAQATIFRAEP